MFRLVAAAAVVIMTAACGRTPSPEISLIGVPAPTAIEVSGLPRRDLDALAKARLSPDEWRRILKVAVTGQALPIAGDYVVVDGTVRFTPLYGFDAGRSFEVTFDASKIPGAASEEAWRRAVTEIVALAGKPMTPTTVVRQVYPSGGEVVANMLRFYIEFSAPMGRGGALDHIRLVDDAGKEVVDPFLPVEADFWTPDRTRFTLFFDPGRVKRGIKPNRDLGRALIPGKRYALVISEAWLDGRGVRLASGHRHEFSVRPANEHPLDVSRWRIDSPKAGTLDPLTVTFPTPLDYGLLKRSLSIRRGNLEVPGDVSIGPLETHWRFTPKDPWKAGDHAVVAWTLLEDPAGNRIGRAFEVMQPVASERESIEIPFTAR